MYSYKWLYYREEWFYFVGDGHMLTSIFYTISNELYYFSDSGAVMTGWFKVGTDVYHADSKGVLDRGTVQMSDYVSSTFDSSGKWLSDTMVDRGKYTTTDGTYQRLNELCDNLEVVDGYRRPALQIAGTSQWNGDMPGIVTSAVDFYTVSDTENRVNLTQATNLATADIVITLGDLSIYQDGWGNYPTGRTYSYNHSNEWVPMMPDGYSGAGEFTTGSISGSLIVMDSKKTLNIRDTYLFRVVCHEIGHVLGLRHPFEEGEAEPSGNFKALMWPYYEQSRASDNLEAYDIAELLKTYP